MPTSIREKDGTCLWIEVYSCNTQKVILGRQISSHLCIYVWKIHYAILRRKYDGRGDRVIGVTGLLICVKDEVRRAGTSESPGFVNAKHRMTRASIPVVSTLVVI